MALLTAMGGIGLALIQADVWDATSRQRLLVVGFVAVLAFSSSSLSAWDEYRRASVEQRRDDVAFALTSAAFAVQDLTTIDVRELGLAVYVVRRGLLRPSRQHLRRVHRERAARRPTVSGVNWAPGKGVIGRCVASGSAVGQDVGADEAPFLSVGEEGWAQVPDHVRGGLTFAEFASVRGKYHVIVAVPIVDDSGRRAHVQGCLALDGPAGSFDDLWSPDVRDTLITAAATLGHYVL